MSHLLHLIEINAKSNKVYALIKDLKGISKWWTQDSSIISKNPLTYHFRFPTGAQNKMKQIESNENHSILWKCVDGHAEWLETQISFELVQKENTIVWC